VERSELQPLIQQAFSQIESTTNTAITWTRLIEKADKMRANEDAQIYQHLEQAFGNILDPKIFPTLRNPQGHSKTIAVDGHSLEVTVVHRAIGIEDLLGVDVFYYLQDWKALAFQHKKRSKDGTFAFSSEERDQRDKIKQLCDNCKLPRKFSNDNGYVRPFCASLYVIGDDKNDIRHTVSACRVEDYRKYFQNSARVALSQFPQPPDLESTDKMFLQCLIGRRLAKRDDELRLKSIDDAFLTGPDLVFRAVLT